MQMLTMDFRYDVSEEQFFRENNVEMARMVANIPGLLWKYWLHNPETKECLGVYHFRDKVSALAYMDSSLIKQFKAMPGYTIVAVKLYDLIEENSIICRAPGVKQTVEKA
jgi:hypothetical protein